MGNWREKLSGEDGVSILYGVLFMLVAVMVASLMLSAAVTAASRVDSEQERNQDSLALRSAGELVRECIEGSSFTVYYGSNSQTGESEVQWATKVNGGSSKNLEDELQGAIQKASGASSWPHTPEKATGSFQVKVNSSSPSNPNLPEALTEGDVEVSYTVEVEKIVESDIVHDRYHINATVTLKDRGQRLFLTAYNDLDPNNLWATQTLNWPASNITLSTKKEASS